MTIEHEENGRIIVPEFLPPHTHLLDQPPFSWLGGELGTGDLNLEIDKYRTLIFKLTWTASIGVPDFKPDSSRSMIQDVSKLLNIPYEDALKATLQVGTYLEPFPFVGSYVKDKRPEIDSHGFQRVLGNNQERKITTYFSYAYNFMKINPPSRYFDVEEIVVNPEILKTDSFSKVVIKEYRYRTERSEK